MTPSTLELAPLRTLDRILAVEPGLSASALRNVPNTLAVLDTHFPRFPVLPGVLILDSLAELAELAAGGKGRTWELAEVRRVQFRRYVQPGDQLELSVEVTGGDAGAPVLRGSVHVEGKLIAQVRELRLRERA
jgi:3-hydroxyacyl-[acyl-carrier-protein] dehydratase